MHVAGRDKIKSGCTEPYYRYVHHMGGGEQMPAFAWAQRGSRRIELSGFEYPEMSAEQLEAKARALV